MAHSSPPGEASSLFTRHRRAYIACSSCRKRKVRRLRLTGVFPAQCLQLSKDDSTPCIRCTHRGINCEYVAVSEDFTSSQPSTSPPHTHVPAREHIYCDSAWTPQPITPPSAGMSAFLSPIPSSSTGVRRHAVSNSRDPYPPRRASTSPMPVSNAQAERPARPRSSSEYSPEEWNWNYPVRPLLAKQSQSPPLEPLQYSVVTQFLAGTYAGDFFVGQNHGEINVPPNGMVYPWPEVMQHAPVSIQSTADLLLVFLISIYTNSPAEIEYPTLNRAVSPQEITFRRTTCATCAYCKDGSPTFIRRDACGEKIMFTANFPPSLHRDNDTMVFARGKLCLESNRDLVNYGNAYAILTAPP
ncbi:hypothetical protein B0H19DRAFT_1067639 [Mycena capillaripes]|nr:hypothetical protein B0H19DRAFT_1067639 [Mycena capillaripes]